MLFRSIPRREWLTIHEASDLIGVSPATLRRWSDAGEIRAFTTPGGHRRFARAAVLGLIPAERRDRTGSRLGDIAARIARAYRRIGSGGAADDPLEREGFLARLDEAERAPFREFAATIALALLELVEGAAERDATTLVRAETAAAAFGALAAARAVPLDQTVDAFLGLRRPFLSELAGGACRQGLDVRQTTDLLAVATEAVDHLIAALVRGHEAGRAPAGLSGMREVPPVTPRIP